MSPTAGRLREAAEAILRDTLAATDAGAATRRALSVSGDLLRVGEADPVRLGEGGRLLLVGAGKAAPRMAQGALEVLGEHPNGGTVTTKHGHALPLPGIEVWEAGHPLPDACGLAGAAAALALARSAGEQDVVLCLLSGGASALWPAPPAGVTLGDVQALTDALLRAGVPIRELNTVRKHLSRIGGGGLARAVAPARLRALLISDVVGDAPETIGSGPTTPDPSLYAEALETVHRLGAAAPAAVRAHLAAGAAGRIPETPKPGDALFRHARTQVILRNGDALAAAARAAEGRGFAVRIVDARLQGEARRAGRRVAERALTATGRTALLWGGETTVTVRGPGRGGRCQELALAAAGVLQGVEGIVVAALGTDGTDGPTDAAGALVDGGTAARIRAGGTDPAEGLVRNDAYPLLRAAGDLLITGPTGTHVNDVVLALVERETPAPGGP